MALDDLLAPNDTMGSMSATQNRDTQGHEDLAVYKAVTDSENFGADPIQAYSEGMAMPPEQVFSELGAKYKQVTYDDLNQLIKDTYTNEPEYLPSDFEEARTIHGQVSADADSPSGPEKYLVSTLNRGTDNDELTQRLANQAYFSRRIRSLVDEQDWKAWASNIAGSLLLNDQSLDISKVAKGSADESAWKSYFSSAENWSKFISAWHSMPPAQQKHDFDILVGLLTEATDNNQLKTVGFLTELLDPTSQPSVQTWQTLDKGFAALDATGVGVIASTVFGRFAAPVKLAKLAKKLDNLDAAAKLTEGAIVDGKIADAVGTSQVEAITSGLPLKADAFMEGAPEDLAQKLKVNFEALDEYNNLSSVRRFGLELTPDEKAAAVQRKVKELEATPDVASVTIGKVTDEGFELTYTVKAPRVQEKASVDSVTTDLYSKMRAGGFGDGTEDTFFDFLFRLQADRADPPGKVLKEFVGTTASRGTTKEKFLADLDAAADGRLAQGQRDIISWLIDQNPNIVTDIEIRKDMRLQVAGNFSPSTGILRLNPLNLNGNTALHEILHSTERLLPNDLKQFIAEQWAKDTKELYKKLNPKDREAMVNLVAAHTTGVRSVAVIQDSLRRLPNDAYLHLNPSEYWADVGSAVLAGRYKDVDPSIVAKLYNWYREFVDKLVVAFGLGKDHAVSKGIDFLLDKSKYTRPTAQDAIIRDSGILKDASDGSKSGSSILKMELEQGADTVTSTTHFFTRDDIDTGFSSSETGIGASFFRFFTSPNAIAGKGDRKSLVNFFESIQLEQEVARRRFAESFRQIFKGLNGESIKKLNLVMAKGRDTEKYYKYSELVPTGILTEQEFTAYANTMKMMDKAFMFKNKEMYDLAKAQGLKEVGLGENILELMKPYDTKESAIAALAQSGEKTAFMPEPLKDSLRDLELTPQVLSDFYDRGYRLVAKAKDKYIKGYDDTYYAFALVKQENIAELPQVILKRREAGYMPIEYKEGLYFVKQVVKGKVGGVERAVDTKTLRYFNNKQDAEKFAEQLVINKEAAASDLRVLHNRELTRDEFGDELVGMHGGLYTGSRGSDELLFGLDGTKGPKVDPMASMSKYFSNIAQRYPMSQYRLAIQQKWMNEARKSWGLPPKFDGSFEQALKFVGSNKDLSVTEKTKAIKSHEQISFQMRVPTQSEREVQTWMRTVAEKIETLPVLGNRKLALAIHRFDHSDPPASVRASAFNLTMGWYNPAPFLVQAFGSTVAMTIDPLNAPKHLRGAFALQALDNMHNPHALDINTKMISGKLADADIPDIKKAWDLSGFKESAMFGHADFQAMDKGLPIDRGALRKMWENQTYFYKQGELFNYRYSFSAAFDWWKRQPGNKKRAIDAKAVDEIVARTNTYLLHMSRANRASSQKGLASIPTQFTKIFTQFYEAMVGKELTLKEKISLLVGQGALFGYAGVEPIGHIVDWAIDKAGGNREDPSPEAVAVRRGLIQTALQEWLGVDVNVAQRGAVAGGFYQAIKEALFERKLIEVAAGASGGITGQRSYETVRQLWNLGSVTDEAPAGSELSDRTWFAAVSTMMAMSSHWRAQTLAHEMYHNKLFRDPRGNLIMRKGDMDVLDYIATAAGYQPAELQAIYLAQEKDRSEQERYADKATSFIATVRKLVDIDGGGYSPEEAENVQIVWNALMGAEVPAAQDKIRGIVIERLTKPKSREDELVAKRIDDLIQGLVRPGMVSDELIPNYKKKEGIE